MIDPLTVRIAASPDDPVAEVVHRELVWRGLSVHRDDHALLWTGRLELSVATQGSEPPPAQLVVDARSSLGGGATRPGGPAAWARLDAGLCEVERALAVATPSRDLRVTLQSHLTAGFALGRRFDRGAGWHLTVAGDHGDVVTGRHGDVVIGAPLATTDAVESDVEIGRFGEAALVLVDLFGVDLSDAAASVTASVGQPVSTRITVRRARGGDLDPPTVSGAAVSVADEIRQVVDRGRPGLVHLLCAAPVEFAVLVAHRLARVDTPIQLYEPVGEDLRPSLLLRRDASL